MSKVRLDDLERRVARLERLLNRVLELIQEMKGGGAGELRAEAADGEPPAPEGAREPARERMEPPPGEPRKVLPRPAGSGRLSTDILSLKGPFLSRLGIVLLLLSVTFFFKYSIDQGWLVPWIRIAIGVAAGLSLVVLGFRGAVKGRHLGTALAGGGIATFFITGYAADQWYSLIPYGAAFGFLVVASGLGVYLSLRSGRQALAMVGLLGALATPLLLTLEKARLEGLALYVVLIVAAIVGIYLARAWRALLVTAAAVSWPVLGIRILLGPQIGALGTWVVQLAILFCALAFWMMPVVRALLQAKDPERWPRGQGTEPYSIRWSAHLDALSILTPVVAILLSAALWELSRAQIGWCFFGGALLAQSFGLWVSRRVDPEDSASTQSMVAIALATVGLGLVLSGDVLYLAFIAEATVLLVAGARKESGVLSAMGVAVGFVVAFLFVVHMSEGARLLAGETSALLDLVALGAVAFTATRLRDEGERRFLLLLAYLGLLFWTARELLPLDGGQALTSIAFGAEGTLVLVAGHLTRRSLVQKTGMATLLLVVVKLLLVDMAAVEPVWRVLLFGLFGGLFLVLSRLTQGRDGGPR